MRQDMAWAGLLLLVLGTATLATARRCCPDDELFMMAEKKCSVTVPHRPLNCSRGMYALDPNKRHRDSFIVTNDDKLQADEALIEADSYCVTHLIQADGTTTKKEVAFVCFPDEDEEDDDGDDSEHAHRTMRHTIMGVFMTISTVFLLATLAVYATLPEMRDLEGKCLMSAVLSLFVSYVLLATLQFHGDRFSDRACISLAFILYFWMLSAFFWLNVVSFNLWRSVLYPSKLSEGSLFMGYCVYGWGCPLLFLIVALVTDHMPGDNVIRPHFGEASCWFNGKVEVWSYFYGPIAVIIACNIAFFVGTAWKLWKAYTNDRAPTLHSMRYKCVLYMKLFIIMGITWIFELLSHLLDPDSKSYVWYVTDIINALQGVLIFIITVACRKRVLRGLTRRRAWGFNWPKRWAAGVDEESDGVLTDEVVEMSQSQQAQQADM